MSEPGREQGWSLAAAPEGDDVRLEVTLPDLAGAPMIAILRLDRTQARTLARSLLAAAGDATERTFQGGRT